jgi:acetoin utilization deacetylase AcuC-like enzyme/GNAT superfamily N-acetyltransferase
MFRIRRVYDDILPLNKETIRQVKEILKTRFTDVSEEEIEQLGEKLRNPFKQRFRSLLFVAETFHNRVMGFALLLHEPEIEFCFLDWIAAASGKTGGGLGSALYETVRREAVDLEVKGLFFECLPDDRNTCPDEDLLKQNRSRLRFYERYGARPVINTAYETPVKPEDTCMPYLVYDGLDQTVLPGSKFMRRVVRAILERKYAGYCPEDYIKKVVRSFKDDPIQLRAYRYVKPDAARARVESQSIEKIALVINDRHSIHHVRERGYVESPVRVGSILKELRKSGLFVEISPRSFPKRHIHAVHDARFEDYLRKACEETPEGKSLYPYIFPIRNKTRPPKVPWLLAGYYCIDTFTPINRNAYPAARRAVDCSLTAAQEMLGGRRISYALVRPPGHHAESQSFGGFCYFNNCAIVAQYLSEYGKVAILDIDYHHGNGQQDIFYHRLDVLTISLHGHPRFAYPYFSGFEDENGAGEGEGFNLNIPLPESLDGHRYRRSLYRAVNRIESFNPAFLVVALGLDTAKGDPTGTWSLSPGDFEENGRIIAKLGLPVLIIQEGGYRNRSLGKNALYFFKGLVSGKNSRQTILDKECKEKLHGVKFRYNIVPEDVERIRKLVEITGFFTPPEVEVAEDLVRECLLKGKKSGYCFVMAEYGGGMVGYACYGPIACTTSSFDLYWIAIHPAFQGRGIGKSLLEETERLIMEAKGTRIYVETSQREQYASTRAFYENSGYHVESILDSFYGPGEGKVTYCINLEGQSIKN